MYAAHRLGARGANLSALASFYQEKWTKVYLEDQTKSARVLSETGMYIAATSTRKPIETAIEPLNAAIDLGLSKEITRMQRL